MIALSIILFPSLLPFSRGFSSLMLGTHHNQVRVSLSERAFVDLWLWRISFYHWHVTNDTSWLSIPTDFPLLHRRIPNETNEEHVAHQGAHAAYVTYGDALPITASVCLYRL